MADFAKTKDFNSFLNRIIPGYINNQEKKNEQTWTSKGFHYFMKLVNE